MFNLFINKEGYDFIFRNLKSSKKTTTFIQTNLEDISFHGDISGYFPDFVTYGIFDTDIGSLNTDLRLTADLNNHALMYSGKIETTGLNLGQLTNDPQLGDIVFDINIKGKHKDNQKPDIQLKGTVSTIGIKD